MDPQYSQRYLFISLLAGAAILMAVLPLVIARFIAPRKPGVSKAAPYECGVESTGDSWMPFRVQYYVYALLFVIFDVEILFLYPWAMVWKSLGVVALVELVIFVAILGVGLAYAWKKGVLEWH